MKPYIGIYYFWELPILAQLNSVQISNMSSLATKYKSTKTRGVVGHILTHHPIWA